jgi:predicted DNA-binding protein YlxM (UPF0122 family)
MSGEADKKPVDWEIVEKHYRAGLKSLRTIAEDAGVTEGAIRKRAKRDGWTRNLEEKIQEKAKEKVRKQAVRTVGTQLTPATEKEVVEQYSDVVASVDMIQRDDVRMAVDASRGHLSELITLTDPAYKDKLQWVATLMERAIRVKAEKGKKKPMPSQEDLNELLEHFHDLAEVYALFKYTTTLHSRVKLAKEIAASHGVYLPLQRKIFGLDAEKKSSGEFEEMLRLVQAEV